MEEEETMTESPERRRAELVCTRGALVNAVCETGANCTSGRQLFDDFGVDTDSLGWAHIAYSHDSPALGGAGTFTGYAIQTGGQPAGSPNN